MNKTKCTCKTPIIESNMCEALCTKCKLLIQMKTLSSADDFICMSKAKQKKFALQEVDNWIKFLDELDPQD